MKKCVLLLSLCLLMQTVSIGAAAYEAKDNREKLIQQKIDTLLTDIYQADKTGAAVLAVKKQKVILRKGYGMANLELGVKIRPEMVFRIGSITKQFTAAAVMILVEKGKISLSDDMTKYLPDYPTGGNRITIHHLLTHTSGIKSYTGMAKWPPVMRKDFKVEKLIDFFKSEPMDFKPGERYLYNNSAYFLLGAIIEKVSGLTYQAFIQKHIFTPLGMKNSYYGSHGNIIPNRVSGYKVVANQFKNADFLSMTQPYSAGSLLSTVDDFYIWARALMGGKVVSLKSLQTMITPLKLNSGKTENYGYGLSITKLKKYRTIGHGGGINGFITHEIYLPDIDGFVIVLSNNENPQVPPQFVCQQIALILVGDSYQPPKEVKIAAAIIDQYVGIYKISKGSFRTITRDGNQLYTQRTGSGRLKAFASSETEFFYKHSFSHFTMIKDKQSKVVKMIMHTFNGDEEAVKTDKKVKVRKSIKLDPGTYKDLVGEYDLTMLKLVVRQEKDKLYIQATGQPEFEIFAEARDKFFLKVVDAQIHFNRDEQGKVTGLFLFQNGRKIIGTKIK